MRTRTGVDLNPHCRSGDCIRQGGAKGPRTFEKASRGQIAEGLAHNRKEQRPESVLNFDASNYIIFPKLCQDIESRRLRDYGDDRGRAGEQVGKGG